MSEKDTNLFFFFFPCSTKNSKQLHKSLNSPEFIWSCWTSLVNSCEPLFYSDLLVHICNPSISWDSYAAKPIYCMISKSVDIWKFLQLRSKCQSALFTCLLSGEIIYWKGPVRATLNLNWVIVTKTCHPFRLLQLIFHTNSTYIIPEIFCLKPLMPFLLSYPISVWEYALTCSRDIFRRKLVMKFKYSSTVCHSLSAKLRREIDIFLWFRHCM